MRTGTISRIMGALPVLAACLFMVACEAAHPGGGSPDTPTYVNTKKEQDRTNDGTVDVATFRVHDGRGNVIREETDLGSDGTIDSVQTWAYDHRGNVTKESYDDDNDGRVDMSVFYHKGVPVRQVWYSRDNGAIDFSVVLVPTYDGNGNPVKVESDHDEDGTIDSVSTLAYDAHGNLTREEQDQGNDGTVDFVRACTFDDQGRMMRMEFDYESDGIVDAFRSYSYDAGGRKTGETLDEDNDGAVDLEITYAYDSNGNLAREVWRPYEGLKLMYLEGVSVTTYTWELLKE